MRIILNISEKTADQHMQFVARAIVYAQTEMKGKMEAIGFRTPFTGGPFVYFSMYRNKHSITIRDAGVGV